MDGSKKVLKRSSTNEALRQRHTVTVGQLSGSFLAGEVEREPVTTRKTKAVAGAREQQQMLSTPWENKEHSRHTVDTGFVSREASPRSTGTSAEGVPSLPLGKLGKPPGHKKGRSFYGSMRINAEGSRSGVPLHEATSKSPRHKLHSPRGKKGTERVARVEPPDVPALIEKVGQLENSLRDCTERRIRLGSGQSSPQKLSQLEGEAEDLRVQHEIAVNMIYNDMGLIEAFKEHRVVHWTEWPLSDLEAAPNPESFDSISPRRFPTIDGQSRLQVRKELPPQLKGELKQSSGEEILTLIESSKKSVEASGARIKAINDQGKAIDGRIAELQKQIGEFSEDRNALMLEKKGLLAERSLQTLFIESAETELKERSSESAQPHSTWVPSLPLSPRSTKNPNE